MKNFVSVILASFVAVSVSAQVANHRVVKLMRDVQNMGPKLESLRPASASANAISVTKAPASFRQVAASAKKAGAEVKLSDAYMVSAYAYVPNNGYLQGTLLPAQYATSDQKVFLDAFGVGAPIEGTVVPGTNRMSKDGADSVYFAANQVLGKNSKGLEIKVSGVSYDNKSGVATFSPTTGVGGYYIADTKELYIPDFLGIAVGDSLLDSYANIDIVPRDTMAQFSLKANIDVTNYGGSAASWTGNAIPFGNGIAIQGLSGKGSEPWVLFDFSKSADGQSYDQTGGAAASFQYVGSGFVYTDKSHTSTTLVYFVLYPCTQATRGFSPVQTGLGFSGSTDDSNNYVMESDGESLYGEVGLAPYNDEATSIYTLYNDWKVTVTNESTTGVKNITTAAKAAKTEYFDLQGRKVNAAAKGVVIVRTVDAQGNVNTKKVIR